jgi:hypothetical protein
MGMGRGVARSPDFLGWVLACPETGGGLVPQAAEPARRTHPGLRTNSTG